MRSLFVPSWTDTEEGRERNRKIWAQGFRIGGRVKAKAVIRDSPLADEDGSCKGGSIGTVEDIDSADGWLLVLFNPAGPILVHPDEATPL